MSKMSLNHVAYFATMHLIIIFSFVDFSQTYPTNQIIQTEDTTHPQLVVTNHGNQSSKIIGFTQKNEKRNISRRSTETRANVHRYGRQSEVYLFTIL